MLADSRFVYARPIPLLRSISLRNFRAWAEAPVANEPWSLLFFSVENFLHLNIETQANSFFELKQSIYVIDDNVNVLTKINLLQRQLNNIRIFTNNSSQVIIIICRTQ